MNSLASYATVRSALRGNRQRRRSNEPQSNFRGLCFPVFIAYSDIPAGRHALGHVKALLQERNSKQNFHFQPMLWRFNQLNDPRWREMALRDSRAASAVVLAMSDQSALCAGAETWLATLAAQCETTITALVLIGENETWTISMQHVAAEAKAVNRPTTPARIAVMSLPQKAETACAA